MTEREIRLGGPLFRSESPALFPFLRRRKEVLQERLRGLLSASVPDKSEICLLQEDLAFLDTFPDIRS